MYCRCGALVKAMASLAGGELRVLPLDLPSQFSLARVFKAERRCSDEFLEDPHGYEPPKGKVCDVRYHDPDDRVYTVTPSTPPEPNTSVAHSTDPRGGGWWMLQVHSPPLPPQAQGV